MKKGVFIGAAILTIIIISFGIQIGINLESARAEETRQFLEDAEILFSDSRLQALYYENDNLTAEQCRNALQSNLLFNDIIYEEGVKLDRYENSNKIIDLTSERKRYGLLQMQFWLNAERIRNKCNFDYSTAIYMFKVNSTDETIRFNQRLTSALLLEVKEECGSKLMLSPMPFNMNLISIDAIKINHNITETPAIIINDEEVVFGVPEKEFLIQKFGC